MTQPHAPQRWAGTALQIAGAVILASRVFSPIVAYPIMLMGSGLWLFIALKRGDRALLVLNGGYSAINLVGIVAWGIGS